MINLIRSEWIKFRSVRSTVVLVLAAGALVVLVAFFAARSEAKDETDGACERVVAAQDEGPSFTESRPCSEVVGDPSFKPTAAHLGDITVGIPFALFLFGALGVQIIGQEYRFNTIRPTFTAAPKRWRVLLAKLAVVTTAIAAISIVMLAVCALIGTVMLDSFTIDGVDHRVIWGTVLFSVGWTMYGMGIGSIIRQPVAGMLILLVEAFVVEQIVAGILPSTAPWMPFLNGIQMTVREAADDRFMSATAGGVYFFAVALALWGIGAVLVDRRDA